MYVEQNKTQFSKNIMVQYPYKSTMFWIGKYALFWKGVIFQKMQVYIHGESIPLNCLHSFHLLILHQHYAMFFRLH